MAVTPPLRPAIRLAAVVLAGSLAAHAAAASPARAQQATLASVADRLEIHELSAQFDNALDSEDEQAFVATFAPDGVLKGFWGASRGPAEVAQAFHFMLDTFARDKRHTVSNHQVWLEGRRARMYSYLTVFDRKQLALTGTATFTDVLEKRGGRWYFVERTLKADPNVQSIIDGLQKK